MTDSDDPATGPGIAGLSLPQLAAAAVAAGVALVLGILIGSLGDAPVAKALIEGLLGWPFLLAVLVLLGACFAGERFLRMMEGRKWSLGKDGISFEEELARVDGEGTDTARRLKALEDRVSQLAGDTPAPEPASDDLAQVLAGYRLVETDKGYEIRKSGKGPTLASVIGEGGGFGGLLGDRRGALAERLERLLSEGPFAWRSIERLALEAGATEAEVREVLAGDRDRFRIGRGAGRREIAQLRG